MNFRYVWIGVGIAALLLGLVYRYDLSLLLSGSSLILSGWGVPRDRGPWVRHPSIRG